MPSHSTPPVTDIDARLHAQLDEELTAVLSVEDEFERVNELMKLLPRLPKDLLSKALDAADKISRPEYRARFLVELAPHLGPEEFSIVYAALRSIGTNPVRTEALGRIHAYASPELQGEIINQIKTVSDSATRLKGWIGMAKALDAQTKEEAIGTALSLSDEQQRADALIALVPSLPDVWKLKALKSARSMTDSVVKIHALAALLPDLPKRERVDVLEEALALARELSSPADKAVFLLKLQPQVPAALQREIFQEILSAALSIQPLVDKTDVLLQVSSQLPPGVDEIVFLGTTVLRQILEGTDEKERADSLIFLAEYGPPEIHGAILDASKKLTDSKIRSRVLINLQAIMEPEAKVGGDLSQVGPTSSKVGGDLSNVGGVSTETAPRFPGSIADIPQPPHPSEVVADHPKAHADHVVATDKEKQQDASSTPSQAKPPTQTQSSTPEVDSPVTQQPHPEKPLAAPQTGGPASEGVKAADAELSESASPEDSVNTKTYLHSDRWTLNDQLNYSIYASAITEFILHPSTEAPLAIGVLAPWGQGKTTLMRLIQNQLQGRAKEITANQQEIAVPAKVTQESRGETETQTENTNEAQPATSRPSGVVTPPLGTSVTFAYLRKWLQNPTGEIAPKKLQYPTVWFNAWKYQNTEQLWAGMAYSILSQLVAQIEEQAEREKFWLALQVERIDLNAVRRDLHRMVFERILPWIAISSVVVVIGLIIFIGGFFAGNALLGSGGGVVLLSGILVPAVKWMFARSKVDSKPLEGKFAQYVRQPTYEGKLGFFHEIETDVQRVFKLLVASRKPAVVFIDDLDRCSPGTVAQVIEAMNLFLSADFPDCYFVVGMDAQVVAASMEVAYESLDKKMKGVTRSYGSLGWYFMDKFIQLQFSIPNLTPDQRAGYLTQLFGQEMAKKGETTKEELDNIEKDVEKTLRATELKTEQLSQQAVEVSKLRQYRPLAHQRLSNTLVKISAEKLSDNNPTLQKQIDRYEPFLGVSPRGIKRFTNLYRFYNLSQITRKTQGLPSCSQSALARWLVIMLRWPQVVRWIQWEGETKFSAGASAQKKAETFEEQLLSTPNYADWVKLLQTIDPKHGDWMSDRQFYDFIKSTARPDEKLSLAVQTGVW